MHLNHLQLAQIVTRLEVNIMMKYHGMKMNIKDYQIGLEELRVA